MADVCFHLVADASDSMDVLACWVFDAPVFGRNEGGRVDVRAGDVADCVDHAGYDESGRQGVADDSQASAGDFVGHCRPGRDEDQRKGSDALGGGSPLQ